MSTVTSADVIFSLPKNLLDDPQGSGVFLGIVIFPHDEKTTGVLVSNGVDWTHLSIEEGECPEPCYVSFESLLSIDTSGAILVTFLGAKVVLSDGVNKVIIPIASPESVGYPFDAVLETTTDLLLDRQSVVFLDESDSEEGEDEWESSMLDVMAAALPESDSEATHVRLNDQVISVGEEDKDPEEVLCLGVFPSKATFDCKFNTPLFRSVLAEARSAIDWAGEGVEAFFRAPYEGVSRAGIVVGDTLRFAFLGAEYNSLRLKKAILKTYYKGGDRLLSDRRLSRTFHKKEVKIKVVEVFPYITEIDYNDILLDAMQIAEGDDILSAVKDGDALLERISALAQKMQKEPSQGDAQYLSMLITRWRWLMGDDTLIKVKLEYVF
jgi:hypothetical protein